MSTGKKLSPMRAFQYSSALDTHSYPPAPVLESELDKLNREIMQKDMQIRFLKQNIEVPSGSTPLKETGKNSSLLLRTRGKSKPDLRKVTVTCVF